MFSWLRNAARRPSAVIGLISALTACLVPPSAQAQLTADQCALIYNADSADSRELASHYAAVRGIPQKYVWGMPLPLRERMTRVEYDELARGVRTFLEALPDGGDIRCLVTFYEVPLRVAGPKLTDQERKLAERLEARQRRNLESFQEVLDEFDPPGGQSSDRTPKGDWSKELSVLLERYGRVRKQMGAAAERLSGKERTKAFGRALQLVEQVEGRSAALAAVQQIQPVPSLKWTERLAETARQERLVEERLVVIWKEGPKSPQYQEGLDLLSAWHGVLGACNRLDADVGRLGVRDCHAALDSELSLVLWDTYDLYRWLPNTLNPRVAVKPRDQGRPKVLMVSRIDAPTPEIARRLIDDAVAVEKTGLAGTFYVDCRGMKARDAYGRCDRDLFDLFQWLRTSSDIPVILDAGGSVFPAGSCPDAALYCGWYSVGRYVPAFTFVRGAVGYHIASIELGSLREKDRGYWCPGLLRDGICATLGPTAEPYLGAFPPATRFFGLLMTGRLTLVECFYQSKPFNSWQMTLLGDPLYRPFAKNPKLTLEQVDELVPVKDGSGMLDSR
jgi:uncharacterized protein (TIGR03790 family)